MNWIIRPRMLKPVDLVVIEQKLKEAWRMVEAGYCSMNETEEQERRQVLREYLCATYRPGEDDLDQRLEAGLTGRQRPGKKI